jgi:Xanthine and CO dehydrogenases maturation factor, XdhC/CoxF family
MEGFPTPKYIFYHPKGGLVLSIEQRLDNKNASGNDHLIIVGSGSAALNIYSLAVIFGYTITIVDRRVETLTRKRFPKAVEILRGDVIQLLQNYDINDSTSLVIVNNNREPDEQLLQIVIKSPARYIGVVGNSRKISASLERLKSMGTAEELIERVHVPASLGLSDDHDVDAALAAMAEINSRFRRDAFEVLTNIYK